MLEQKVLKFMQEHNLIEAGDRILVGVSGGPDSLCLLHLLNSLAPRLKINLAVGHLNHGIRPEAAAEAEMVRSLAAGWSLPFVLKKVNVPRFAEARSLSEEEAGRILRYRFLGEAARRCGANKIAVGHHRDDQAETVLFNLLRGTGPDGLAGMLPERAFGPVRLIRPLLSLTRCEIEHYCRHHGLKPALDSSNLETEYTRNRIRLELIPHLEKTYNPRVKEALARFAALAAADRAYLQARAERALKVIARRRGDRLIISKKRLQVLPEALRGRVLRLALEEFFRDRQVEWVHVRLLMDLLRDEDAAREAVLPGDRMAYSSSSHLVLAPRRLRAKSWTGARPLHIPGRTYLPDGGWIDAQIVPPAELPWPPSPKQAYLDYSLLPPTLSVRTRWPGARFHPQGAPGSKKLKEFFIDQKIPRQNRDRYPLVVSPQAEIIWVAGLRIAHPYRITAQTEKVLVLSWQDKQSKSKNSKGTANGEEAPKEELFS